MSSSFKAPINLIKNKQKTNNGNNKKHKEETHADEDEIKNTEQYLVMRAVWSMPSERELILHTKVRELNKYINQLITPQS